MKSEETKVEAKEEKPVTAAKLPQQPEAKPESRKWRGALHHQFAAAVAEHVLRTMDITYLEGHHSLDKFAEKVFLLADVLVKESHK